MYRFLAVIGASAALVLGAGATVAHATEGDPHKVYVCKYVGTPGVDEILQTGQNPIEVDIAALEDGFVGTFPFEFEDAQGNSIAIGYVGEQYPVLTIDDCPAGESPSPTPSESPSPTESTTPPPTSSTSTPPATHTSSTSLIPPKSGSNIPPTAFTGGFPWTAAGIAVGLLAMGTLALWYARKRAATG